MWDRLTERAKKVISYARQEAQRLGHEYIGTEHLLLGVVKEGTGRRCNLEKWQVMGKTGTAQVPRIGQGRRGYEPNAYLGSFIAAAPASDPAVVVLVMIRKPQRSIGYYGSVVALPAVRAILEETLPYLEIPPDKPAGDDGGRLVTAKGRN